MQLKIDFHVHTLYSYDSLITPDELVFYAKKSGLDGVAVTDHDRLDGALRIAKETKFTIVPGIEVSSLHGHILGLNVQEPVPRDLEVDETVDRIHEAGGIAVACHPIAFFKGSLGKRVSSKFDAVEVINSSAFPFGYCAKRSEKVALRLGLPRVAGSDAHYAPEIGHAHTLVDAEPETEEIVNAVAKGLCQPFGKAIPLAAILRREFMATFRK